VFIFSGPLRCFAFVVVINPVVKCMMVENWFNPYKSVGCKWRLHMVYVAGSIWVEPAMGGRWTQGPDGEKRGDLHQGWTFGAEALVLWTNRKGKVAL
jgi:hypothetical protein